MKSILKLKTFALMLLSVFTLFSCLDSDDDDFMIVGSGYIIQQDTNEFIPMVMITGNDYLAQANCKGPEKTSVPVEKIENGIYYQTDIRLSMPSSKMPVGTYTIQAQNADGEVAQNQFAITATKHMSKKLEGDIKLEGKKVTATFNEIPEATRYFVFFEKTQYAYAKIQAHPTKSYWSAKELKDANWTVSFDVTDKTWESIQSGYKIVIAAAVLEGSYVSVYQEGDYESVTK